MNISLEIIGNSAIKVLTPLLTINFGDANASFLVSVDSVAGESNGFVRFVKQELGAPVYQQITPLKIIVSSDLITINVEDLVTMYVGGKS